jgi:hypothetical protein
MNTIIRATLPAFALLATVAVAQAQTAQPQDPKVHHPAAQAQNAAPATPKPGMGMGGMGMGGMGMGMMQQMQGGTGSMPMMQMGGGGMGMPFEHAEGRIAFLKAEIGITDAQQKVWDAFAEALRQNAGSMRKMHQRMMAKAPSDSMSFPERLEGMAGMASARAEALKVLGSAARPLYDALSEEQRGKANSLLAGPMGMM